MSQLGDGSPVWTYYPVHTIPASLDIVWCRFPQLPKTRPGPKNRPALVRTVDLSRDHAFARVEVCYGTSQLKKDRYPFDLFIENASQLTLLGLSQATRFELDRTLWLPWASEFFVSKDGPKTPIIGRLSDQEIGQLHTLVRLRRTLKRGK